MINIIQKGTSTVRATAEKLQYSGTFMEIPQLAVTVKSPTKIAWEIGDFITWSYDGATYVLKELPQEMKQSTSGTYGEAFVHENIRFIAPQGDLKYVDFLDVVKTGSTSNFSTLPTFSFFGDCYALIDRINANIGRLYANWEIKAADVESGDIFDALNLERNVEITSPIKVWDALGLFYSMWGLGFVYSYDTVNAKHNLTIGATGGVTGNFSYGQGNGLYMVSKNIAREDAIVTRLRPYGSTRNMPSRYYNNKVILIDRQLFTDPMVYLPNLMIPYWKWAYTNGDPKDAYINCNNVDVDAEDTSYAKYGIREASVFFDGTNGLPDIYPTIERITAKNIRDGIAALQYESEEYPLYHSPSVAIYPDTERMDLVKLGDTLTDNGVVITTEIYTQTATFAGDTANYPTTIESFTLAFDPIYSKTLAKEGEFKATLNSQEVVLSGVDTTIDSAKLKMWLTKNGSRSRLVTTIEGNPVGGVFTFILPDFIFATQEEGDTYAVEVDIDITIPPIGELGIANVNYVFEAGSLTYELTKITPITTFAINVKQIGFDIKRFLPNAGQSPVISMTSGACQGREFIIKDTRYNSATDDWTLTCARQSDTSLSNQWFPNANFHIASGDSFVVLNINMPEFFINIAEERLYAAACDWLRKRKEPQWVYEPKIDEIYMAYNPQVIKEGMMMPLVDTDLAISGRNTINTVTITENEGAVRTFDVVLREDADKDLLKYINEAAKRESSSAVGSITNADTSKTESAEKQSVVVTSSSGTTPTELSNASTSATPNTLVLRTADGDANVRDINASRKVKGATLILPQSAPTLAGGEMAIYGLESGFSGETPSGAGSMTNIRLTLPTGLEVSLDNTNFAQSQQITGEGGTFYTRIATNYVLPTALALANKLETSLKGSANGLAELDENGFVKNTQLPSYVDDVLEYGYFSELPVTGESGKIYVITNALDTEHYNKTYRWSGTIYTEISASLALGETSSTAYRGDRGKIAYDHSQVTIGNPHGTTAADVGALALSGGTLTSPNLSILEIKRTSGYGAIKFIKDNTINVGWIGVSADETPVYHNANGDVRSIYHSANANLSSVDWSAAKLTSTTLILPQSAPTLSSSEVAIYSLDSGFSGETPSGAGSMTNITLSLPTGLEVSLDNTNFAQSKQITGEGGTFYTRIATNYFLPTTTQWATKLDTSLKGSANGLAELDENGFVKNTQLPSYVDDVIEVDNFAALPATGETGKIYVTKDDNKTWRWGGSVYVQMYAGIALGETSATAYRGDRGKIAYDHSQSTGNPHGTTAADVGALALSGGTLTSSNLSILEIKRTSGYGAIKFIKDNTINVGWIGVSADETPVYHNANGDVRSIYHSANANRNSIDWSAAKLASTTLILPQTTPSLASGEMAIYGLESGFSGEIPSGAGSVESVALVSNLTGISVTGSPITTSGTFTLNFVIGYSIPTNTKQGEWDNAYTNRITSLTTTGSGAATLVNNVLNIPTYTLPTATDSVLGGVKIGTNVTITDGVISVHNPVTLGTANGLSLSTQELSLGLASASANGALSSTDWNTFNDKQAKLIGTGASSLVRVNTLGVIAYDDNTYLTTATAASTYLPLSGGTISGGLTLTGGLTSNGTGAPYWAAKQLDIDRFLISTYTGIIGGVDNDANVGIYNYGTGNIGFWTNGDKRMELLSTGILMLGANSVYHSGNSNTDSIDWSAKNLTLAGSITGATTITASSTIQATTAKLTNLSDGYIPYHENDANGLKNSILQTSGNNLKIGTTWEFKSNGVFYWGEESGILSWDTSYALISATTGKDLRLGTAGYNDAIRVDTSGRVAINQTTASEALDVNGGVKMTENINTNLRIPKVAPTSPTSGQYYFYIVE